MRLMKRYLLCFVGLSYCAIAADTLDVRYEKLSCAVVKVQFDGGTGTAFFANDSGRLATVAHVLYDRTYRIAANDVVADVTARRQLSIEFPKGTTTPLTVPMPSTEDGRMALFDLALIETGLKTPCFIPFGDSDAVKVGQHLLSIGFPGVSTSQVLYEGFLSARAARLPLSFGPIQGRPNLSYAPRYEVFRIQMPITPGASGSPVVTDTNTVIGIVSEVPVVLTNDVQRIAEAFGGNRNVSSGVSLSGFDVTKTLGELSWIVSQFESPGAGLAVPVSNLHLPPSPPPAKPVAGKSGKSKTSSPKSQ
jgi:S1-C subfamily serine protease